jgi:hypothetical protein
VCAEQRVDSGGLKSLWRPNEGRYIQKRVSITRWLKRVEGTEKPKRARRRKLDTAKAVLGPPFSFHFRGQGVHREVESEGHEEKYRAVIDGGTLRR